MWVVCKYKRSELNLLKINLKKSLDRNIKFYIPKIKYKKIFKNKIKFTEENILEEYMFCYHPIFSNKKILNLLSFTKGLKYFLTNNWNQIEIKNFLEYCKKFENKEGYLTQKFFYNENMIKAKFLDGPFANMMFEIISRNKNKIRISLGKIETTISTNKYLFRSI